MATIQQGVPQLNTPLISGDGSITQPWYLFLINLWARTGGSQNNNPVGTYSGEIRLFGGPSSQLPSGWLICDGSAVGRITYPNLFGAIGTTWGAGDGVTTFNLPNFQGKAVFGVGPGFALGSHGGNQTVALSSANLASHNHAVSDPGHTHLVNDSGHTHTVTDPGHIHTITDPGHIHTTAVPASNGTAGAAAVGATSGNTGSSTTGITINSHVTGVTNQTNTTGVTNASSTTGITTSNTGTGTPFSIIPPYAVANYMIKT